MAESWHAQGPTHLLVALDVSSPSYAAFARTDNEDLVGFEIEDIQRTFTRNDLGDMVAEVITTGSTCFISFTATWWDEAKLQDLLSVFRSGATGLTEGYHAEVGALVASLGSLSSSRLFGLQIATTNSGEKSYMFPLCRLAQPHQMRDFGNTMKKLIMVVEALPNGSGSFYSVTTNS